MSGLFDVCVQEKICEHLLLIFEHILVILDAFFCLRQISDRKYLGLNTSCCFFFFKSAGIVVESVLTSSGTKVQICNIKAPHFFK